MEKRFRTAKALQRRGAVRQPYDRVLIVCEGSRTEPRYFKEMVNDLRLSSANIEVTGDSGSAPQSVVSYAIRRFEEDPTFDQVYCVVDRDGHARFDEALERVRNKTLVKRAQGRSLGPATFTAIPSIPCFEYWLLLHFTYTTAPLPRYSDVEPLLKAQPGFESYGKGSTNVYELTKAKLPQALSNADRSNAVAEEAQTDNPTTKIPIIVRALQEIAGISPRR